jgi:signal peptidase II
VALFFASCLALLLLDQWSKKAALTRLGRERISLGTFLQISCILNSNQVYRGGLIRVGLAFLWCISFSAALLLRSRGVLFQSGVSLAGLGAALGGAAGNLIDILRRHAVIDFVDVGWWPVFNLADVGIVAGLILAFLA